MAASASPSQPDPDALIAEEMKRFEFDPLGYVLFVFDWGQGDLEGETGPDKWQADFLRDIGEAMRTSETAVRFAVASGHGVGKTALSAWIIHWFMATRPGCAGDVTANTKDQLEGKTWRELAKWNRRAINGHWFDWTATAFKAKERGDHWFIKAQPWTKERSEAFAGRHEGDVLMLMDEASAIDDIIWEVTEGALTQKGALQIALGNLTRSTGRFRECFGRLRHRWRTANVDSRQAKMTNKAQIAEWIEDYGEDSDFVRVRVKGEAPRAGSMQFIGGDVVDAAMARDAVCNMWEPLIIGVDCARYGDDSSVIAFRRGRDAATIPWRQFRNIDTMTLAAEIARAMDEEKPDAVFIDEGSFGAGVIDRLRHLHRTVMAVRFGDPPSGNRIVDGDFAKPVNKRAEMWMMMRAWLKGGALPDDSELEADLTGLEYGYWGPDDLTILESKKDMKKRGLASPDKGDALACTFAEPVAAKSDHTQVIRMGQATDMTTYNPYGPDAT